jgi:hypothetical protein
VSGILDELPSDQRAELRVIPIRDLEAELEWRATSIASLEQRLDHAAEPDELALWGLGLERQCELLKAEILRRLALGRPLTGPRYSRQWIMELKARIDLPEFIVGMHDGTRLKRSGNHCVGLCPFHVENTGSFHVWNDHYWCFSCHEHGDVFDWLLKKACSSWVEAVEYVARYLGVPLPDPAQPRTVLGAYVR